MKIEYKEINGKGVEVLRVFGATPEIMLPDLIEGKPVIKIGDYAFSPHKKKEEEHPLVWKSDDKKDVFLLYGKDVISVTLPKYLDEIGRYAFYGCSNLKKLSFTDMLLRTGAGIFTGCELKEVEVDFYHGESSILKEIVSDTRFALTATLRYHKKGQKAVLDFPEYFEEAVENTPARIVPIYYNGTGYKYRQCFTRGTIDYDKYDSLLPDTIAQEKPEVVWHLIMERLKYPYGLKEQAKEKYIDYVKKHFEEMSKAFMEADDMESLTFLMNEQKEMAPRKKSFDLSWDD